MRMGAFLVSIQIRKKILSLAGISWIARAAIPKNFSGDQNTFDGSGKNRANYVEKILAFFPILKITTLM